MLLYFFFRGGINNLAVRRKNYQTAHKIHDLIFFERSLLSGMNFIYGVLFCVDKPACEVSQ